jgi:uncharacterized membrane protein YkvA (DUF1232 family)
MEQHHDIAAESFSTAFKGFVKVWKTHKTTGEKKLVLEKDNLILAMGANVLAYALAGQQSSNVSTMYVGYNNNSSFSYPTIDTAYSQPFNGLSIGAGFGYLREPLSFSPNFLSDAGYTDNTVIFTTMISSASAFYGNTFTSGTSQIYECALVVTPTNNAADDLVFSRINFSQIEYDDSYNLTISWGVKFLVS